MIIAAARHWPRHLHILQEEFLIPLAVSQYRLAREVAVPPQRINAVWVSEWLSASLSWQCVRLDAF